MPGMEDRVCLITGATNGIGKATALELARMGASLIIVGRNSDKTSAVSAEIKNATGNTRLTTYIADLSSMAEVRRLAKEVKAEHDRIHVLLNNVGAIFQKRQVTADGFELTFALNHLSYFLLTHLLLDVLKASTPARIINVASEAHKSSRADFSDLYAEKHYGILSAYSLSKLFNIMFTYELAHRLEGTGITANALHPGMVRSGFGRNSSGAMRFVMTTLAPLFSISPEAGAKTPAYLASSPEAEGVSGKYFVKCRPASSSAASYDQAAWKKLWEISEKMVQI